MPLPTEAAHFTRSEVWARLRVGVPPVSCDFANPAFSVGVAGANNLLYGANANGVEARRQDTLAVLWRFVADTPRGYALDCSRDASGVKLGGRPGVLYFVDGAVRSVVTALVVDSRGFDVTAPWPMEQHDPRRTNSAETSLAPFSCP